MNNLFTLTAALLAVAATPLAAKSLPIDNALAVGVSKVAEAVNQQVAHQHNKTYQPTFAMSTSNAKLVDTTISKSKLKTTAVAEAVCNDDAFITSGANLLAQVKSQGYDCVERLFGDASDAVLAGTFTEQNILTIAAETKAKSIAYDGTDADRYLTSLHYWIRAFYYYDNRNLLTQANQQATKEAMDAFVGNSHFYDRTEENGNVVDIAVVNLGNAGISEHYMSTVNGMLDRYSIDYEKTEGWGDAMAYLSWSVMNGCAREASCRISEHTPALATKIGNFIHSNIDWLKKPNADYHLHNLGYQLANMYSSKSDANFATLKPALETQLNKIFTTFGPYKADVGRRGYLLALDAVNYHNQCSVYSLCGKSDEIIANVLDDRINCPSGTLVMWAQDMNQAQLEWACNSLSSHETYFHQKLNTNNAPVVPDDNENLRMVVFNDRSEWQTYGGVLFNASTNNGGLYLEGDPSVAGDQATFFAYEEVPARPVFDIWNLRHEYIHYLDGRFNTQGDFHDMNQVGSSVWYGEGVAEYISLKDCNDGSVAEARLGSHDISTIFANEYGVSQNRIYSWGYLAVRYMFEQQNETFVNMLNLFKQGDYQGYRTNMVDKWVAEKTYDADFNQWLQTVDSTGCSVDNTRPPSPVEPINIDDIQGDEQAGVNACALGRTPEGRNMEAGIGACLIDVSNNNQAQLGINVPNGLVDVTLQLTLRHGTGNGNLLHRFDSRPNDNEFDNISAGPDNNETVMVDNVQAGWHYVHVRADSEFSGATLLARFIQNDDSVLQNGVSKSFSGSKDEELRITFDVPAGASNLSFNLSGGTGDADMHVKFGSEATTTDFDCRPYKGGNVERCDISTVQAGTYHVMLRGYKDFANAALLAQFDTGSSSNGSELQNGVSRDVSGSQSSETHYSIDVPAGASNLVIATSGGAGDVDIHVKSGGLATLSDYDCRPWKVGSQESCSFATPQAGVYDILLLGHSDYSGVALTASFE